MTNGIDTGNASSGFLRWRLQVINQGAEQVRQAAVDLSSANNPNPYRCNYSRRSRKSKQIPKNPTWRRG